MKIEYSQQIKTFYERFLINLPADSSYRGRAWSPEKWGDSPEASDTLGALIAAGEKTASCTTYWAWAADRFRFPALGLLTMVLDGADNPLCIIETYELSLRKFKEVDAAFAAAEADGDRSLLHWRKSRWLWFTEQLKTLGHTMTEDMVLVCERYRRIF
jgi:uncharacterized protein YhfF